MTGIIKPLLVSVIIPTFNRSRFLVDAVESIIAQDHRPIEVIIIDDGSSSNDLAAVQEYIKHIGCGPDLSIRLLQQQHLGQRVARNRGLAQSQGEFIQFLDDDDSLHPEKFSIQLSSFHQDPTLDVVVSQVAFCDSEMHPLSISNIIYRLCEGDMVDFFLDLQHDVAIHAPLHRRRVLLDVGGFDERGTFGDEVSLHLRLAISGAKFIFLSSVLGYVRCHQQPGRVTIVRQEKTAVEEEKFYQRIIDFSETRLGCRNGRLRCGVAKRLISIARRHYSTFHPLTANGCIISATSICPEFKPLVVKIYPKLGGLSGCLFEWPYRTTRRVFRKLVRLIN